MSVELLGADVTRSTFPGGESCIRINKKELVSKWAFIEFRFENNGDLIDLAMMVDACRRHYDAETKYLLIMPYLPYARQDRVCNPGESLSVKVVCDFINGLKFDEVRVKDIHSQVGVALLDNLKHDTLNDCAYPLFNYERPENTCLVSPDAGAEKKVFDFAKEHGYNSVIRATKVRNVATGKIERTTIIDPLAVTNHSYLILDDICDGGRTFIELAKAIKDDKDYFGQPIKLYVTHGIFSAGLDKLSEMFDTIYVSNLMNKSLVGNPLIKVI
jgi:ribose-phosphate pyrophosphokinase